MVVCGRGSALVQNERALDDVCGYALYLCRYGLFGGDILFLADVDADSYHVGLCAAHVLETDINRGDAGQLQKGRFSGILDTTDLR